MIQTKIEPLTADELGLLQYLFSRHRDECYAEIGAEVKGSYENSVADLTKLSEIKRKLLEAHLTQGNLNHLDLQDKV